MNHTFQKRRESVLDAIEKAIRQAFDKGDPSDRAFREKVYRSAFAALEKALQTNPGMTPEVMQHRRTQLGRRISEIESEFIPAVAAAPQPTQARPMPEVSIDSAPQNSRPAPAPTPSLDHDFDRSPRPAGATRDAIYDDVIDAPEPAYAKPARRGRPLMGILVGLMLLAAIAIGAWWAVSSGLLLSPSERDQSVPNPPATVEDEDFDPDAPAPQIPGAVGGLEDWIAVFDPTDPTSVAAPGDSTAEAMDGDSGPFMRIRSGASGSPILFDVGQGVLEELAGKRAVFAVVARAEEGAGTTMSVDCSLGELGDCGRKRYAVGPTQEEFLFEIDLPNVDPGAGGTIAINPDMDGSGKVVDIYAIRVSPAQ